MPNTQDKDMKNHEGDKSGGNGKGQGNDNNKPPMESEKGGNKDSDKKGSGSY